MKRIEGKFPRLKTFWAGTFVEKLLKLYNWTVEVVKPVKNKGVRVSCGTLVLACWAYAGLAKQEPKIF